MERVRARGRAAQLVLDLLERGRVDQVAQLLLAEQLLQQVAVERERLGAPLGERRVVLVHVRGDVVEEERRGERRGARRLDLDEVDTALPERLEEPAERGQVEDVLEHLAVGLEHDREVRVAAGDLQEALRLEPLLPERRPLAGPAARDQERARRVLAEARAEERRPADLGDDEVLQLLRADEQLLLGRRRVRVGQVERDAVVRPDEVDLEPERLAQARGERQRPGRVHAGAERREDAEAPVADLVAEALDDDRAVRREHAGRLLLLAEEDEQVLGGALVELVLRRQALAGALVVERDQLAAGAADRLAELVRPADALALPERHQARDAGSGRDEHAVARDLLDPPRRGAEEERLADARLVDHLLVELADAPAALDEVHAEQPAVRDRPRVGHREPARALAPAQETGDPVPGDARAQLGELLGRVAAGEHVEHVLELLAREVAERPGPADEVVELVDRDLLLGADGDDLLGEHVERVARDARLLDQPLLHAPDDDGRLEQIGPELREDAALGRLVQAMAGAADPLEPAGDRLRRLDLDDQVDRAHVDAELERGRGDEARDVAALQQLLDLDALLARERPVVGARDLAPPPARSGAGRAARRGGGC